MTDIMGFIEIIVQGSVRQAQSETHLRRRSQADKMTRANLLRAIALPLKMPADELAR
jgi:hypothetical protein